MKDVKKFLRKEFKIAAEDLADHIIFYFNEYGDEVTADEFIEMFKEEAGNCIEEYVRSLEADREV